MNLLMEWLWQGLLIAAVTSMAVRLIPARAAAARHAIWWLALAAVLMRPWLPSGTLTIAGLAGSAPAAIAEPAGLTLPLPPAWLLTAAVVIWVATALWGLLRLFLALRSLRQLVRAASRLTPEREARVTRWTGARTLARPVQLRLSRHIPGACAIGFFRPTVLISSDLSATLSDEALESIVLHECAHLERYDDWTGLVQQLVLAVAWLHPAVRWISRAIDLEREVACDQWVVARTGSPVGYARGLTAAAAVIVRARGRMPAAAPGASTTMPLLQTRIERLIHRPATSRQTALGVSGWCLAGLLAALIASDRLPAMVTFASREAPLLTAATALFSADLIHQLPRGGTPPAPSVPGTVLERQRKPTAAASPATTDETPAAAEGDRDAVLRASTIMAPAVTPPRSAVLESTSLTASAAPFALPAGGDAVDDRPLGQRFAGIGVAAARAGTATGATTSRAGKAVGRFFKTGGVAIGRTF